MEIYNVTSLQELLKIKRATLFEKIEENIILTIKKRLKTKTKIYIPSIFLNYLLENAKKVLNTDNLSLKDAIMQIKSYQELYPTLSTKIYTIANIKGGVGKTILSVNIAHSFSLFKKKVLLIDLDPQANSTDYLEARNEKNINSLLEYYFKNKKFSKEIVKETIIKKEFENAIIDVIPSEIMFARNLEYARMAIDNPHKILKKIIDTIKEDYEFIIIDTPPSPGLAQQMALYTTDKIIVPTLPDEFSIDGLIDLIKETNYIKDEFDKENLLIEAIFINKVKPTNVIRANIETIQEIAKESDIKNIYEIPESSRIVEAVNLKLPLLEYKPELDVNLKASENILIFTYNEILNSCTVQD
jgi:chromosome partitioning protein